MTGYLLDTNVLSEYNKPHPDPQVHRWLRSLPDELLFVSVLTFGEIQRGIAKLPLGARRSALQTWLDRDLKGRFSGRIIQLDEAVAAEWGRVMGQADAAGRPLPIVDSLLAATALHHTLTFVTRDTSELAITGVKLLNPWQI